MTRCRVIPAVHTGLALALALAFALAPAHAAGCWAPDNDVPVEPAVSKDAPLDDWEKTLDSVKALFRANRRLVARDELRARLSTWLRAPEEQGQPNLAAVRFALHPKTAWSPDGDCELISNADFFIAGDVHVRFNDSEAMFGKDAFDVPAVEGYFEPQVATTVSGETAYAHGAIVLAPAGLAPWLPVTRGEYQDALVRAAHDNVERADKRLHDLETARYDAKTASRTADSLEGVDPQVVAEMRRAIAENAKTFERTRQEALPAARKDRDDTRAALAAAEEARRALAPAEVAAPLVLPKGRVVRVNPALWQAGGQSAGTATVTTTGAATGTHVKLIVVTWLVKDKAFGDEIEGAVRALDFRKLRALLPPRT